MLVLVLVLVWSWSGRAARRGSATAVTSAAATAMLPATVKPVVMAVVKLSWATLSTCGPSGPACAAVASAAAIDERAALRTGAGRPLAVRPWRNEEATMLPMIAMPRLAPSSWTVSLIALPAPACSGGSTDMIDSPAGAMTRPMPAPMIATPVAMKV